jgi:hypothetical protein
METVSALAFFLAVVLAAGGVHWITRGTLQPWYSLILAIWALGMFFVALMIADYGWSTLDLSLPSLLIPAVPLLLLPFAKKKRRGKLDL